MLMGLMQVQRVANCELRLPLVRLERQKRFLFYAAAATCSRQHNCHTYVARARTVCAQFPPLGGATATAAWFRFGSTATSKQWRNWRQSMRLAPDIDLWTHGKLGNAMFGHSSCGYLLNIRQQFAGKKSINSTKPKKMYNGTKEIIFKPAFN